MLTAPSSEGANHGTNEVRFVKEEQQSEKQVLFEKQNETKGLVATCIRVTLNRILMRFRLSLSIPNIFPYSLKEGTVINLQSLFYYYLFILLNFILILLYKVL